MFNDENFLKFATISLIFAAFLCIVGVFTVDFHVLQLILKISFVSLVLSSIVSFSIFLWRNL